jgi:glycosyltransferase involved in cell wall biosynthesis
MGEVFFSIIIPTFNSGKTIRHAIESILDQTFSNFEVLIQDGCSGDDTLTIINSIKDERIRMESISDSGIYDAMNKATFRSKGKWLYYLGSDDRLYSPETLSKVKTAIETHPESLFFYGDVFTSENVIQSYADYNFEKLLEINICHQAIFYSSALMKVAVYDLRFSLMADWDMNLKLFNRKNAPFYLNFPVSYYNLEGASTRWYKLTEYKNHFSNKRKMLLQYGGIGRFLHHYKKRLFGSGRSEKQ